MSKNVTVFVRDFIRSDVSRTINHNGTSNSFTDIVNDINIIINNAYLVNNINIQVSNAVFNNVYVNVKNNTYNNIKDRYVTKKTLEFVYGKVTS